MLYELYVLQGSAPDRVARHFSKLKVDGWAGLGWAAPSKKLLRSVNSHWRVHLEPPGTGSSTRKRKSGVLVREIPGQKGRFTTTGTLALVPDGLVEGGAAEAAPASPAGQPADRP